MKVGFLITARLKSTRLPKKLLLEVNGAPLVIWMLRRLKLSPILSEVVLCTSTHPQDDELVEIVEREGIRVFRGSEEDVIQRLYDAAVLYNLDYVINMTADCPLLPYERIEQMVDTYIQTDADLVKCHDLPAGFFLSGLKPAAMKRLIDMKDSGFTEYWLYYFLKTDLFKVIPLAIDEHLKRPDYRFILDYPEDYTFLKKVYEALGPDAYKKTTEEILALVDQHPEWAEINRDCRVKGDQRTKEDKTSKVILKDGTIID